MKRKADSPTQNFAVESANPIEITVNGFSTDHRVNTTMSNIKVIPIIETVKIESIQRTTNISEVNGVIGTETTINITETVVETNVVEYTELDQDYHEIILTYGKQTSFWPWISKFEPLFGLSQLLKFLSSLNGLDLKIEDDQDQMLMKVRELFEITVAVINSAVSDLDYNYSAL